MRAALALTMLVALTVCPTRASAQEIPAPNLEKVYVRSIDGFEIEGRLLRLGPTSLSVFAEGAVRELPLEAVDRIERSGDRLRNGALIGAAVGGTLLSLTLAQAGSDYLPMVLVGATTYAFIGAGIDAMIPGRTTIYARPRQTASAPGQGRVRLAFKIGF